MTERRRRAIGSTWLIVGLSALALAPACALARSAVQAGRPSVRGWGGTLIRPLDAPEPRAAGAAAQPEPSPPAAPPGQAFSDEVTTSRWANPAYLSAIYSRPDGRSRRIGRLRWFTEDGFPEVYLLLDRVVDRQKRDWIKLRIPMRPNGREGWVPREALGPLHVNHTLLVVDRPRLRISLFWNGRLRWRAPVGVGKPSTPTPPGRFWIRERFRVLDSSSPYAPYAFGTADYSALSDWPGGGVVGIHGDWHMPWLIPGRPSHGCIRLRRRDDVWLARHLSVGTPLRVI
jgi:hypothetical protein